MIAVSNAGRVVFPEAGHTKGDVVAYYEAMAARILPHVVGRPLTLRRFPKGIGAPGFFQKNVPAHYPSSMGRIELPKRDGVTAHPIVREAEHLAFVANQGAIELHVPCACASDLAHPDRIVMDLDPPEGAIELARRGAHAVRREMDAYGVATVPVATGSKGYHVVAAIVPSVSVLDIAEAMQAFALLLTAKHPEIFTTVFRVAKRGGRIYCDWLRNVPGATVVAPFSLRARPFASVATPLTWSELDERAPDHFRLAQLEELRDRADPLFELTKTPSDARPFVESVQKAFEASGLVLERFDRFRA